MAGSLVLISEATASTSASITLTGIDSTYDVYMVRVVNYIPVTDDKDLQGRVTVSGSADSTSNYDRANLLLRTDTSFSDASSTNQDKFRLANGIGNATGEAASCTLYLFNFNNSSEYSFITVEQTGINKDGTFMGKQGGEVHTVAQACDGIQFFAESGNIDSGEFKLYGLKK